MNMKIFKYLNAIKENASRISLGLVFLVFGLNGFFNFFSTPTPPVEAHAFLGGLAAAPYFFPLLMGAEALCGLLLVLGRYVNLALVALAPIVVNVVLYHVFLDFSVNSLILPTVVVLLYTQLVWKNRDAFSALAER
tara:strand:+ start:6777 stop:7184 length:408 start_codon:yes stop_codon:yes gene_type:complete